MVDRFAGILRVRIGEEARAPSEPACGPPATRRPVVSKSAGEKDGSTGESPIRPRPPAHRKNIYMIDIALPAAPLAAYLVVWVVAALDLFVPILPTGTLMIAGGALAAQGKLAPVLLIAAGTLGAWLGDLGGYRLGRRLARKLAHLATHRDRGSRPDLPAWQRQFARHTVLSLIVARYLPAGRTVTAVTAGRQNFPGGDTPRRP